MLVKNAMKKPYVIEKDISLKKAAELMSEKGISSLVVVKGKKVIGIITREDLVENFSANKNVFSVMSRDVITINEDEKTKIAIEIMQKNKFSFLPVVDDNSRLVGLIHIKDLIEDSENDDFLIN